MKNALTYILILVLTPLLLVTGCSSMPGVLEGNDLSHLSLRDKRISDRKVKVLKATPTQSKVLGQVSSQRCQSTAFSDAPSKKTLLVDMKAEAYRLGANALGEITVTQRGAISEGCWNVFTASADMLVVE